MLHRIFLGAITAVVLTALLLCLLYAIGFLLMNLSAKEDGYRAAVEVIEHALEDIERLELVDQQRVFLLIGRVLHGLLEVIQLTEVLFPLIVDDEEQHTFLELFDHLFAMCLRRSLEVHGDVIDTLAVGDRNKDVLVHLALGLEDLLDDGISHLHQFVHTALETLESRLRELFAQFALASAVEGLLVERRFDRKGLHDVVFESLVVIRCTGVSEDILCRLVDHIGDIDAYTLTHQGMLTLRVDEVSLLVHHIVVLDKALTDTEVVLLDFLLRPLDRARYHAVLDHLTFLEAHAVHHACYTVATEHTHQVIFERHIEDRRSRVTLTTGTTA